jgi:16S rRNA (uracil1498-N3)-methyltransferase
VVVPDAPAGWPAASAAAAHVFVAALTDDCTVDGADGHHLQRVRRLRERELVTAADGAGCWREYEIAAVAPGRLELRAAGPVRREPQRQPRVSVAIALAKGNALDDVVAGLTELGVHRIEPVRAERSVVRWDDARAAAAVDRWRDIAREAAMQARRADVPDVAPVADLASLQGRSGLLVADRSGAPAGALGAPPAGEWLVVVGPEGGLTASEIALLAAPAVAVGRHVLRARTAPLAVVAAVLDRTIAVPDVVN